MRVATIGADGGLRDADGRSLGGVSRPSARRASPRFLGYTTPPPRPAFLSQGAVAKGQARRMAESLSVPAADLTYMPVKADPEKHLFPGRLVFLPTDVSLYSISFRPSRSDMIYLFEVEGPGASSWKKVPIASLTAYSVVRAGDDMAIQAGISLPTPKLWNGRNARILGAQYPADMLATAMDVYATWMPLPDSLENPATQTTYMAEVLPAALAAASLVIEAVDVAAASYDALAIGRKAYLILAKVSAELVSKAIKILELAAEADSSGQPAPAIEAARMSKTMMDDFPLLGALLARAVILDAMNAYYEVTVAPQEAHGFASRVVDVLSRAEKEGANLVSHGKISGDQLDTAIRYGRDFLKDYETRRVLFNNTLNQTTAAMRASRMDYIRYNEMLPRLLAENESIIRDLRVGRVSMASDEYLSNVPAHLNGLGTNGGGARATPRSAGEKLLREATARALLKIRKLPKAERLTELKRVREGLGPEFEAVFVSGRKAWTDVEARASKVGLDVKAPNARQAAKLIKSIKSELRGTPKGSEKYIALEKELETVASLYSNPTANVLDAGRAESAALATVLANAKDFSKPLGPVIQEAYKLLSNESAFFDIRDVPEATVINFLIKARAMIGSEPAAIGYFAKSLVSMTGGLSPAEGQAILTKLGTSIQDMLATFEQLRTQEMDPTKAIPPDKLLILKEEYEQVLSALKSIAEGVKYLEAEQNIEAAIARAQDILANRIPSTPEELANAGALILKATTGMTAAAGIPPAATAPPPAPGESPATRVEVAPLDAAAAPAVQANRDATDAISAATGIPVPVPAPPAPAPPPAAVVPPAPAPAPEPAPVPAAPDVVAVPSVPAIPPTTVEAAATALADPARAEAVRTGLRTWSESMKKILEWLKRRTLVIWTKTALEKAFGAFGPRREGVAPFSWANVATSPYRLVRLLWKTKAGLGIVGLAGLVTLSELFGITNFFGTGAVPPDPRRVDPPKPPPDEPLIPDAYKPYVYVGAGVLGLILLRNFLQGSDEATTQPRPRPAPG